jgi:phosphatidylglycerophosphate synthase
MGLLVSGRMRNRAPCTTKRARGADCCARCTIAHESSPRAFVRLLLSQIFSGISLDCLDGMQARKTGRCSKLGEVLDHSLDAANVPIIGCCVLMTIFPDVYTIMISVIGGSMIYNAQLVIYRHHHIFVLPPLTGPAAQAMACAASILFGFFYLFFSRHNYFVQVFIIIFAMIGNIAQFQNCHFYTKHLRSSFETSCIMPHVRFTIVMAMHGLMLLAGFLTPSEYMLSAIFLAYRLNGKYVLDTLQNFKPFSAAHTKDTIRQQDTAWRWECVLAIIALHAIAITCGVGEQAKDLHHVTSVTGLPFITDSIFHLALYASMIGCVAGNAYDLIKAAPILATK